MAKYTCVCVVTHPSQQHLNPRVAFSLSQLLSLSHACSLATKLPFDVKQPNRLSLRPPSLSLSLPLCILILLSAPFFSSSLYLRTIIAFVPQRSPVVLNFYVSPQSRGKEEREEEREKKERKRTCIDSSRCAPNAVRCTPLVKKVLVKKRNRPACARVFRRSIN